MTPLSIAVLLCCATASLGAKTADLKSTFNEASSNTNFIHYANGKNADLFAALFAPLCQVTALNKTRGHFWYKRGEVADWHMRGLTILQSVKTMTYIVKVDAVKLYGSGTLETKAGVKGTFEHTFIKDETTGEYLINLAKYELEG